MAEEKKTEKDEKEKEIPIGDCIVEITASAERKINTGNYESVGLFLSMKVQVPRNGDPEKMARDLIAYVDRHASLEERRIRAARKAL